MSDKSHDELMTPDGAVTPIDTDYQVGLPLEGIALIMGVDRLLDMIRTAVNITGDCAVTCIVAKSEGALDLERYNDMKAGEEDERIVFKPSTQS